MVPILMFSVLKSTSFAGDPTLVPAGQYLSASVFTAYPLSRGSIHISGPEIEDKPEFRTGFLSDANDVDILKHLWAYKKQREIFRRMKTYRGEVESFHPKFAINSNAAPVRTNHEPSGNVTDIEYTAEDDEAIKQWAREYVATTWHSMGTCRMGAREDAAVVDRNLNVYGVDGLKVADLSIPPLNVAANTMNTAVAIGEKAADILIKELGL
jgi:alcohol oxidase